MRFSLGLCNLYRRFVPSFARLSSPLNKNLKEGVLLQFELYYTKRDAVDVRKEKLVTLHVLALPRLNGQYRNDANACDAQVGCGLLQE